jgi:hypothetical protein
MMSLKSYYKIGLLYSEFHSLIVLFLKTFYFLNRICLFFFLLLMKLHRHFVLSQVRVQMCRAQFYGVYRNYCMECIISYNWLIIVYFF